MLCFLTPFYNYANFSRIKIIILFPYFNMTSRTFKITYVVHITFLLDGASLGRIKSQKRHSVMLHTGLVVLFYEKCSVFKISLLNCPTQARPPRFITLHLKAHSSEEIAGLSFSSFFFSKTQRLRSSDIISTKFSEGNK